MGKQTKKRKRSPASPQGSSAQSRQAAHQQPLHWTFLLQAVLIVAAVLLIYWPTFQGGWLWDDDVYITDNSLLRDATGLWKSWFQPGVSLEYYPLMTTVEWVQWHLWGADKLGYHLTNVGLHLVCSLLVWRLLAKFGLRLAWLGGLLFAIHPVMVESVAWVTELKNTLSLLPFLLAMCAWIDFDARRSNRDYYLALFFFLIAMLCKTTMALFPALILLYAWWRRGRVRWKDLQEITPFLAVSLALGLTSIALQEHQVSPTLEFTPGEAISSVTVACESVPFYLSKIVLPVRLLPDYPPITPFSPVLLLCCLILAGMMGWFWMKRADWGRHALLGVGFFLINLVPVFAVIVMKFKLMIWSMDHMVYLPIIGLIGLAVAGLEGIDRQLPKSIHPLAVAMVTVVMALLTWQSWSYASLFINQETLLTYTLRYNPADWILRNNLGYAFLGAGQDAKAMEQFEEALLIRPNYAEAHNNLGKALLNLGRVQESIDQYQLAVKLKPDYATAYNGLGYALVQANRIPEAIGEFKLALQIKPDNAEAHSNLGNALCQAGRASEAIDEYKTALQLNPDFVEAHNNLGSALLQLGRIPEAIDQYKEAVQLKPDYGAAHDNLGNALLQSNRPSDAIDQFQQALQINPQDATAQSNLTKAQALLKNGSAAN